MSGAPTRGTLLLRETSISVVINVAISAGFFIAFFGLHGEVPAAALARDSFPQAFAIGLMGSLVPGLLTQARVKRGDVVPRQGRPRLGVPVRSLLLAITSGIGLGGCAFLAISTAAPARIEWTHAMLFKLIFGALTAALVTPISVRAALLQGTPKPQRSYN